MKYEKNKNIDLLRHAFRQNFVSFTKHKNHQIIASSNHDIERWFQWNLVFHIVSKCKNNRNEAVLQTKSRNDILKHDILWRDILQRDIL